MCYYHNGQSYSSFHDDNEECLDPSAPIIVVSLGVGRVVDFIRPMEFRNGQHKPIHSIKPDDGSKYVMKPGCQTFFQHGVRKDGRVKRGRFCLSFRRMISVDKQPAVPPVLSPIKTLIDQFNNVNQPIPTSPPSPSSQSPTVGQDVDPKRYYVPQSPLKKKKTTVLFGTSMTSRIRNNRIAVKGRRFVNISVSGAKIKHIRENVLDFYQNHQAANDVEKIIFSFGTNDIKYSRRGV